MPVKKIKKTSGKTVAKNAKSSTAKRMSKKQPAKVTKKSTAKTNKKTIKKVEKKSIKKAVKKIAPKAKKPVKTAAKKSPIKKTAKKTPSVKKAASTKKTSAVKRAVRQPKKKTIQSQQKKIHAKKTIGKPIAVTTSIATASSSALPESQATVITSLRKKKKKSEKNQDMFDQFSEVVSTELPQKTLLGSLEFKPYQAETDERYMNEKQQEHFRKILEAWKQQLMQDVDLTVGHLKEDAEFYADPVDRAAQEEGFNLELRTRDRERKLIKKIERALDMITNGEYGYCEDCGTEIGIRRLEARPTAMKCIDCKTFQEIREKQLGG